MNYFVVLYTVWHAEDENIPHKTTKVGVGFEIFMVVSG